MELEVEEALTLGVGSPMWSAEYWGQRAWQVQRFRECQVNLDLSVSYRDRGAKIPCTLPLCLQQSFRSIVIKPVGDCLTVRASNSGCQTLFIKGQMASILVLEQGDK